MNIQRPTSKKRGFTLVELLVVIALIAALASLAITGVRKAFQSADVAKTSQNMKEIYNALETLTSEGVDTGLHPPNCFPPAAGTLEDDPQPDFIWWDLVAEKLGFASQESSSYKWAEPFSETIFQNPLSEKTLGEGKDDWTSLYNDPEITRGSFAYNAELGGDVSANADSESADVIPTARVQDESSTIYFGESDDNSTTKGWIFTGVENAPQGNYKESAHCMFLDGAVKLIKNSVLKDPESFDYYSRVSGKNLGNAPD
jgi:prepilin-type N-terminal cleavage/methylation domain-containing protein